VEPRQDPAAARLNDGALDRQGRYWSGSVDNAVAGGDPSGWAEGSRAALYRLDHDGSTERVDSGFIATNGPLIGKDGKTLYLNDSLARTTFQYDVHDNGTLGPRRIFHEYDSTYGYPDGMTCDADGCIWIAFFQDSFLRRYEPDGTLVSKHELPVRQGTRPAFGGPQLDRLFISSASLSFKDQDWIDQPLAGSLFEIFESDARGIPVVPFPG
jgi:sugar lactone lactonase YvrE